MSVDSALRATLRNFATLFLVVAAVTVPVHVVHAFLFRDVEAVRDIHDGIEDLEPDQQVREVSPGDLEDFRTSSMWITAAELVLIPLLAGAARRVLFADIHSELTRVRSAWAGSVSAWRIPLDARGSLTAVAVGVLMAAAVTLMATRVLALIVEPVPDDLAFGPLGLGRGIARALGAPFFLVPLALYAGKAKAMSSCADSLALPDN